MVAQHTRGSISLTSAGRVLCKIRSANVVDLRGRRWLRPRQDGHLPTELSRLPRPRCSLVRIEDHSRLQSSNLHERWIEIEEGYSVHRREHGCEKRSQVQFHFVDGGKKPGRPLRLRRRYCRQDQLHLRLLFDRSRAACQSFWPVTSEPAPLLARDYNSLFHPPAKPPGLYLVGGQVTSTGRHVHACEWPSAPPL
jgi:hypothetical protein